jgi:hypothetical protein
MKILKGFGAVLALWCLALPSMAGGGLRFDTSTTVTAGDATSWMNGFWDWDGTGTPSPNAPRTMTVTTSSDSSELVLKFAIPDHTNDFQGGPLKVGDQVIVELDKRNQRTNLLSPGDSFRFRITISQKQITTATIITPGAANAWLTSAPITFGATNTTCTPPYTSGCASLSLNGADYAVELHIPYTAIGLASRPTFDLGLAILVSNDIGADDSMGKHLQTAVSFPFADMPAGVDDFDDPGLVQPTTNGTTNVWNTPTHWGVAQFTAPGSDLTMLTFSHNPAFYFSEAIKISTCSAGNWSQIDAADTSGNETALKNWYKYFAANPCKMGVWVTATNLSPTTSINARVLVLWADGGLAPSNDWKVVGLSDPVSFGPGLSTTHLVWDKVPAGGSSVVGGATHPCMKVYILPATLSAAQSAAVSAIHDGPTLNAFEAAFVTNGQNLSGMSPQAAQMNFTNLSSGSCTDSACLQASNLVPDGLFNLLGIQKANAQDRDSATGDGHVIIATPVNPNAKGGGDGDGTGTGNPKKEPWFGVRVTGFAVPATASPLPYVFMTEVGGLGWAVPYTMVSDGTLKLAFNVTNPPLLYRDFTVSPIKDYPAPKRKIIMISEVHAPAGYPTPKFTLDNPTPELDAGATIVATVSVDKTSGATGSLPQWIQCLLAGNLLCWLVLLIILAILYFLIRRLMKSSSSP